MCSVLAIEQLVHSGEDASTSCMIFIKVILEQADAATMAPAARALGTLIASAASGVTHGFIEQLMTTAIESLAPTAEARRQQTACLVLEQLAKAAPTIFHGRMDTFCSRIWVALQAPLRDTRLAAASAVGECLQLLGHRSDNHARR